MRLVRIALDFGIIARENDDFIFPLKKFENKTNLIKLI